MKKLQYIPNLLIALLVFIAACSKKSNEVPETLLQKDPSVHESFGLKINFSAYGLPKFNGNAWGTANQFFISAEKGILKADFASNVISNIASNSGGIVTGLSMDKLKMLLVGNINNNLGYYTYSIASSGPLVNVLSLNKDECTGLLFDNNHLLLHTGTVVATGRPCTSLWDFWCGIGYTVQNAALYHIDAVSKASTLIGSSHSAILISGDGQKALISGNNKFYLYDLNLLQKTDSFTYNNGLYFWDNNGLRALHVAINGDVVINNPISNTEIDRFQTSTPLFTSSIRDIIWGPTGRKIYYTGPCQSGGCSYAIWSFDLDTRQEKQYVFTTASAGTSPFEEIQISPDERNMVFRHINSLYLKAL